MKPICAIVVFAVLAMSSLITGIVSYNEASYCIELDINNALNTTMKGRSSYVIDADTISVYRNNIRNVAVRDTAYLAMEMQERNGKRQYVMTAHSGCSSGKILSLSDQRASALLLTLSMLWGVASMLYIRRRNPRRAVAMFGDSVLYGNMMFVPKDGRFYSVCNGHVDYVHLTPMQQQLMEMFYKSDKKILSKQEICDALWPNKPDASETLYTLIRRIKPIIKAHGDLNIESDRGRAYMLKHR